MIAKLLLDKKREGRALGSAEIRELVEGFTRGDVPDYQMSAFAMAVCCRGMTERETADLTEAMMNSGSTLDWGGLVTADKHSTGGVGDKTSLVLCPMVAAQGVKIPAGFAFMVEDRYRYGRIAQIVRGGYVKHCNCRRVNIGATRQHFRQRLGYGAAQKRVDPFQTIYCHIPTLISQRC